MIYKHKGFSLIELLSVIAILGIILSAIVPRIGTYSKSAKKAMFLSDAKTIISAVELYNVENDESIAINDTDTLENVKGKLMPDDQSKKYLTNWPQQFPFKVITIKDLKDFIENPNDEKYYKK